MVRSLLGRCISLSALICVLALFFFPLATGPFPVTHGPATAFRARQAFLVLLFVITSAAFHLFGRVPALLLAAIGMTELGGARSETACLAGRSSVLRC